MELEITKYSNGKAEAEYIQIEKMKNKIQPQNLLLIFEFDSVEKGQTINYLEIKKVQFLANCKTKFNIEILVAFYLNNEGNLDGHIISELPQGYESGRAHLIDYKSYCDICELTGETKLPITEYFFEVKNCYIGTNTIIKFEDKNYNFTEQIEMWKLIDKSTAKSAL